MIEKLLKNVLCCLFCIVLGVLLISNPYITNLGYSFQSNFASCDGINNFYTGLGFMNDYLSIYTIIHKKCDLDNHNETIKSAFVLYPPKVIIDDCKSKPVDCEDTSHFIKCLADLYNISCYHYTQISSTEEWHAGIKCFVNDSLIKLN